MRMHETNKNTHEHHDDKSHAVRAGARMPFSHARCTRLSHCMALPRGAAAARAGPGEAQVARSRARARARATMRWAQLGAAPPRRREARVVIRLPRVHVRMGRHASGSGQGRAAAASRSGPRSRRRRPPRDPKEAAARPAAAGAASHRTHRSLHRSATTRRAHSASDSPAQRLPLASCGGRSARAPRRPPGAPSGGLYNASLARPPRSRDPRRASIARATPPRTWDTPPAFCRGRQR